MSRHKCSNITRVRRLGVRTSAQTTLREVLLQLLHHLLRLRELKFARGPLLNSSPELRTATVGAHQRHLEAAPPGLGRIHPHWKLRGLQAQRLAQGRSVAPIDASARAMLNNDASLLHSLPAASRRLLLLGRRAQRRLGLPLPPAGCHGAWSRAGNRADRGRY
uniref:Selenoprotein H n=2 Tax=Sus scrofa TaxID=9823 RepID=A0A480G1M8_PIG